ncbi:MoaD/ThiS family protein [Pedobacter aquatilis]|uniref:MoaD/ThiS family protein n=1 Tax=Pedobacter aquatilis TaxID=351343 RepID=UPI002930FFA4|nr:MoaD/ThiS family protein [Pedobacter aquatilis]
MEIQIISFGKISEFIDNQNIDIDSINDTDGLKLYLEQLFPNLVGMKYKLALNKNLVQHNLEIHERDTIAIMPPFSGG